MTGHMRRKRLIETFLPQTYFTENLTQMTQEVVNRRTPWMVNSKQPDTSAYKGKSGEFIPLRRPIGTGGATGPCSCIAAFVRGT